MESEKRRATTSELRNQSSEPIRAWISLIAAYIASILLSLVYYVSGVVYVALLDHFRDDPVKASLVFSLNSGLMCFLGPLAGIFINIFSCRVVVVSGGLIAATSTFIGAFVPSVDWLIITFGILGGIGGAFMFIPLTVVLGFCFTKHRDVLMALQSAMMGLGIILATPLGLHLIRQYGVTGTFIIFSGICLNICVLGMLMKPSVRERTLQKRRRLAEVEKPSFDSNSGPCGKATVALRALVVVFLDPPFVMFLISTIAWNIMLSICVNHMPNYLVSKGDSESHVSSIMVFFSISNTVGRLLGAISLRKFDPLKVSITVLCIAGVSAMTFPLYNQFKYVEYVFVIFAGSSTGVPVALVSPIAVRFMGVEHLSIAYGSIYFACGIGYIAGPPIASALYKNTGSYDSSFVFAGIVNLVGGCCVLLSLIIHTRRPKPTLTQLEQHVETTVELMTGNEKYTEDI